LRLRCLGREKLGDGTVAASAVHTADNYHRIAAFLRGPRDRGHHRITRSLHRHDEAKHQSDHTAKSVDRRALLDRLSTGRAGLSAPAQPPEPPARRSQSGRLLVGHPAVRSR
jgi:hypothetical protein